MVQTIRKYLLSMVIILIIVVFCLRCIEMSCANPIEMPKALKKNTMPQDKARYMKISQIIENTMHKTSSFILDGGPVASLPIPLIKQGALKISFLYYPFRYQNQSVYTPVFLQTIDAESGEMEEIRAATDKDFGLNHGKRDLLGHLEEIPGITRDEIDHNEQRLYGLYDKLLPEFANSQFPVSVEIKALAVEFRKLFNYMSEAPLRPYYQVIGKDFFAWIDRITLQ